MNKRKAAIIECYGWQTPTPKITLVDEFVTVEKSPFHLLTGWMLMMVERVEK
jgi:hypothetical protein